MTGEWLDAATRAAEMDRMAVEIHEAEEWAAVYLDGRLVQIGDKYLADEWVRDHFGVRTVQDDAFLRGQGSRDGAAQTLDELYLYAARRADLEAQAARLRRQAEELLARADRLRPT